MPFEGLVDPTSYTVRWPERGNLTQLVEHLQRLETSHIDGITVAQRLQSSGVRAYERHLEDWFETALEQTFLQLDVESSNIDGRSKTI